MEWILGHLPVLVIAFMIVSFLRAVAKAAKRAKEQAQQPPNQTVMRGGDPDAAERTRRIQEEIRRKIAERRGETPARMTRPPETSRLPESGSPWERKRTPELDPFGGPMGRVFRKLEEAAQPMQREPERAPERTAPEELPPAAAVLERQQQLAEQMRQLEETRLRELRRASELMASTGPAARAAEAAKAARVELLSDLREAKSLRRAIVLREVLGPPVALR